MAKYDSQLTELKTLLPNAKNILIALPVNGDIDKFAAGLALFLALGQQNKQVSVVSDDTIRVVQSHLFGVDHIQKNLPATEGGNLIITLEGVAASDGSVPALEKLDWYPEGANLNLVFHTVAGQSFQPAKVVPHYQGSGFDLIFAIGALNLNALGNIYASNEQSFSGVPVVNIDNQTGNTSFGQTNVIDGEAASLSEMMADLIPSLGLPFDADEASNLLAGIFEATNNLTSPNVNADTFMAVANCLRAGGKKPSAEMTNNSGLDLSKFMPVASQTQVVQPEPQPAQDFTVPPVVNPTADSSSNQPSPEERPQFEGLTPAENIEVEPGWLTPKVFKGSSAG